MRMRKRKREREREPTIDSGWKSHVAVPFLHPGHVPLEQLSLLLFLFTCLAQLLLSIKTLTGDTHITHITSHHVTSRHITSHRHKPSLSDISAFMKNAWLAVIKNSACSFERNISDFDVMCKKFYFAVFFKEVFQFG